MSNQLSPGQCLYKTVDHGNGDLNRNFVALVTEQEQKVFLYSSKTHEVSNHGKVLCRYQRGRDHVALLNAVSNTLPTRYNTAQTKNIDMERVAKGNTDGVRGEIGLTSLPTAQKARSAFSLKDRTSTCQLRDCFNKMIDASLTGGTRIIDQIFFDPNYQESGKKNITTEFAILLCNPKVFEILKSLGYQLTLYVDATGSIVKSLSCCKENLI